MQRYIILLDNSTTDNIENTLNFLKTKTDTNYSKTISNLINHKNSIAKWAGAVEYTNVDSYQCS